MTYRQNDIWPFHFLLFSNIVLWKTIKKIEYKIDVIVTGHRLTWRSSKKLRAIARMRRRGTAVNREAENKIYEFFLLCGSILSRKQVPLSRFLYPISKQRRRSFSSINRHFSTHVIKINLFKTYRLKRRQTSAWEKTSRLMPCTWRT